MLDHILTSNSIQYSISSIVMDYEYGLWSSSLYYARSIFISTETNIRSWGIRLEHCTFRLVHFVKLRKWRGSPSYGTYQRLAEVQLSVVTKILLQKHSAAELHLAIDTAPNYVIANHRYIDTQCTFPSRKPLESTHYLGIVICYIHIL